MREMFQRISRMSKILLSGLKNKPLFTMLTARYESTLLP